MAEKTDTQENKIDKSLPQAEQQTQERHTQPEALTSEEVEEKEKAIKENKKRSTRK